MLFGTVCGSLTSRQPIFYSKDDKAIATTRAAMYEAAETLLRLLSPFMPFLTEEVVYCCQAVPLTS